MRFIEHEVSYPKVTVLTTVRDGERTIDCCIRSILKQSFVDWHMLIIDDGSSDATIAIVERWSERDSRITVHRAGAIGRGKALNLGLELAQTEFIAILDCDDVFHSKKLEQQLSTLDRQPFIDVLSTWAQPLLGYGQPSFDWRSQNELLTEQIKPTRFSAGNCIVHSSVMMRRRKVLEIGGYNELRRRQFDYDLWIRLGKSGAEIWELCSPLVAKRIHANQRYGSRNRLGYLWSSLALQAQAIRFSGGGGWNYGLIVIRVVLGLLPRRIRLLTKRMVLNAGVFKTIL